MKIICVGQNYLEHIKELNHEVPTEPVLFIKPDTALLQKNQPFFYPDFSKDIHYETEIVLHINKVGKNIQEKFANTYYDSIGIGIDFTARDIQRHSKDKGLPWEKAKAFDGSAPISQIFIPKEEFADLNNINFHLTRNNVVIQKGNTNDLIFKFDHLVSYISQFFTLKIGDLIYTGTPVGVGPVKIGDDLVAYIEDKKMLEVSIR
ncbi:MAG: fumarylacetoacetate hydrolase family protein [Bacteroidota bacterium]